MEDFYRGKSVFLTGATGFLGRVYCEKMLRSLPIDKLFVLVREKKGKDASHRFFSELLSSSCFDLLRSIHTTDFEQFIKSKVVVIPGDVSLDGLGISAQDRERLKNEVNIIIHSAATILFDEPLRDALDLNTLGTVRLFRMAQTFKNLAVYCHISTAYVGCTKPGRVEEKLHHVIQGDPTVVLNKLLEMSPEELNKNTKKIIGEFPNTYTFTKSLGEELLVQSRGSTPLLLLRPTIVGAAFKEPRTGWLDTLSAAAAIYTAAGHGLARMLRGDIAGTGDQIPVDMAVNATLVACMKCAHQNKVSIAHVGTSCSNPLKWSKAHSAILPYWHIYPPTRKIAQAEFLVIKNPLLYRIVYALRFTIPTKAYITAAKLPIASEEMKKTAKLVEKFASRQLKIAQSFEHFTCGTWIFDDTQTRNWWRSLSEHDKNNFNFDVTLIEWPQYLLHFCWGIKYFCLKEPCPFPTEDRMQLLPHTEKPGPFGDLRWAWRRGQKVTPHQIPEDLKLSILRSERVQVAIKDVAKAQGITEAAMETAAYKILETMSGDIWINVIRVLGWVFRKAYRNLYSQICVDQIGLNRLIKLCAKKVPIVLAPTHRSYVDFLILSYVLFSYGLPVPHIAAGDDFLDMVGVRFLLRKSGAFFMRRTLGTDQVYRAIFTEYIQRLISNGYMLEFFLEGTRSRSGKSLSPKMGILSIVADSYLSGKVDDFVVLPVSMSYDKVIEEDQHVREQMGEQKPRMSLRGLLTSGMSRLTNRNFGRILMQFGEPISMKQYSEKYTSQKRSDGLSNFDPFARLDDRRALVGDLAKVLIQSLEKEWVVMSTSITSAILLTERPVISREVLIAKYAWLTSEIEKRGGRVDWMEQGTAQKMVDHSLNLLKDTVVIRRNIIEVTMPQKKDYRTLLLLGYYANQLMHIFFAEGICACILLSASLSLLHRHRAPTPLAQPSRPSLLSSLSASLSFSTPSSTPSAPSPSALVGAVDILPLSSEHSFLFDLLSLEFPGNKKEGLEDTVEKMIKRGILERVPPSEKETQEGNNDDSEKKSQFRIQVSSTASTLFDFLARLFAPLVDTYWVTAFTLLSLQPNLSIEKRKLIVRIQATAEKLYFDGTLHYFESCTRDSIATALSRFTSWGVIGKGESEDSLSLCGTYQDKELHKLVSHISKFRLSAIALPSPVDRTLFHDFPFLAKF